MDRHINKSWTSIKVGQKIDKNWRKTAIKVDRNMNKCGQKHLKRRRQKRCWKININKSWKLIKVGKETLISMNKNINKRRQKH